MLNIKQEKDGEKLTVALEGRLDTTSAPQLDKELGTLGDDVKELVFDIKYLDYVSSAGLRILLSMHKTMNARGRMVLRGANENEKKCALDNFIFMQNLANIEMIKFVEANEEIQPCTSKPIGNAEILIAMKDLINKDEEIKRLKGMIQKLEANIKSGESKLSNEAFVSKAPAKIIEGAKAQLELNKTQLEKVVAQLHEIENL